MSLADSASVRISFAYVQRIAKLYGTYRNKEEVQQSHLINIIRMDAITSEDLSCPVQAL